MDADGGEGERLLVSVAAEADEQRLLVEQPDAAGERMDLQPRLERPLDRLGHAQQVADELDVTLGALAVTEQQLARALNVSSYTSPRPLP